MTTVTTTAGTAIAAGLPASLQGTADQARQMIRNRHSESTRRAYASDVLAFKQWAEQHGQQVLPASPQTVALFITSQAEQQLAAATITRRLAAIRYLHRESGHANPCDCELVAATMSGIRRSVGVAQRQAAPATADRLKAMLDACGDSLQGKRDRALLAVGFGGALRRSELAGIQVDDIEATQEGLRIRLRQSKTDQDSRGQTVPVLDGRNLQVKAALADWLAASGITSGPVFRTLGKGDRVLPTAITGRSIADIVKRRAGQVGLDPEQFSGHSLRAGFLTSAAGAGATTFAMMTISRHKKVDTLATYVRTAQQFRDHAGQAFM
jgi:site-specific recombinase XerD